MMTKNPSVNDFQVVSMIGKGTYAKVLLVRSKDDHHLYALKSLKKKFILEKNQEKHIMTEKQILAAISHPFLVKMKLSFQDEQKLYFLLEYCPGGELFSVLSAKDIISEEHARFYSSQIVLALDALHKKKIVYRDLKPENIILDRTGYIKLTDFGLSKILSDEQTTMSVCGTPEYLAPEIIKKVGHGVEVDWWCLGCLIHEMVTGHPPFRGENRMELFQHIIYKPVEVSKLSPKLQSLLKKLLAKDPSKRLGHNSVKQIKEHCWFEGLNWDSILHKKIKAPFTPKLSSEIDTHHFDQEFTKCRADSLEDHEVPEEIEDKFKDFEFEA